MTYWDNPADRDGQDPYAVATETVSHYQERIQFYQGLLDRIGQHGVYLAVAPEVARANTEKEIARYQGYLESLLERKRAAGQPIPWEYANANDVVFVVGDDTIFGTGQPYLRKDVVALCQGDEVTAARQVLKIQRGQARPEKIVEYLQEGCYEQCAYDTDHDALRHACGGTIFNRVTIVHSPGVATELVFGEGLDYLVDEHDWEASLDTMREWFATLSVDAFGQPAPLVTFSPAKMLSHREPLPLFDSLGDGHDGVSIAGGAVQIRSDLDMDLTSDVHQHALERLLADMADDLRIAIPARP